ncbi:MAG: hypothetical protein AAFV96_04935 [Pseudomonadota bacterium]
MSRIKLLQPSLALMGSVLGLALIAASHAPVEGRTAAQGNLIAVQALKDKCYNKGADGTRVEVKCPDVIVAKPSSSSSTRPSTVQRNATLAAQVAQAKRRPARASALKGRVPISKGTYNCYNENPPNSGHFDRVTCPDEIVLDTNT